MTPHLSSQKLHWSSVEQDGIFVLVLLHLRFFVISSAFLTDGRDPLTSKQKTHPPNVLQRMDKITEGPLMLLKRAKDSGEFVKVSFLGIVNSFS